MELLNNQMVDKVLLDMNTVGIGPKTVIPNGSGVNEIAKSPRTKSLEMIGNCKDNYCKYCKMTIWLVVSNMCYFPCHIWDVIHAIDFHVFQDGYCTTNQVLIYPDASARKRVS